MALHAGFAVTASTVSNVCGSSTRARDAAYRLTGVDVTVSGIGIVWNAEVTAATAAAGPGSTLNASRVAAATPGRSRYETSRPSSCREMRSCAVRR